MVRAVQQGQELPTILLVEDDPLIQGMVEDALIEGGFKVAIVTSAEDATSLINGAKALVTDIHLGGGKDGWELARLARENRPELPIVYMTGAAADEWPSRGVPNSILLTKPFAPAQLVTAVSQLLNSSMPPGP